MPKTNRERPADVGSVQARELTTKRERARVLGARGLRKRGHTDMASEKMGEDAGFFEIYVSEEEILP